MADKIFDSGVLPEIAVTDTTPIPTINGIGLWTKITGLGIKNYLSSVFSKYSGDADFYQYSISRTVSGGNLTVALKNYEGNDPTPSVPVKIMIGRVVRTITSAMSITISAGTNWMNLGSAELATKEADLFQYIGYSITSSQVFIGTSRIPSANTWGDFINTTTNEKYANVTSGPTYSINDPVVNIGRFNAILSAGGAYTWSIPATSVIVNSPVYKARTSQALPQLFGTTTFGTGQTYSDRFCDYTIKGNELHFVIAIAASSFGTASGFLGITLPFQPKTQGARHKIEFAGYACDIGSAPMTANKGIPEAYDNSGGIFFHNSVDANNLTVGGVSSSTIFRVSGYYNI